MQAVVAAMERFSSQTTVQLSALLCFIPLALENIMMQAGWPADVLDAVTSCIDILHCKGSWLHIVCFASVMCYAICSGVS